MANLDITCMSLVRLVKALSLQLRQIYAGSPLSLVTATKNIFQLTLNSEQSTSVSERQKRHSKVVAIDVANYILHTSCIFTDHLSELLSHLSQKILWKYYEIPCACVISAYQALPPIFRAPEKEASSTTTKTSTSPITRPQTLMRKSIWWAYTFCSDYYCHSGPPLKFKTPHIWFTGSGLWFHHR